MINYYVASALGKRSFDQSKIVKDAWENDGTFYNMTAADIGKVCVDAGVPVDKTKVCTDAGESCKGNSKCEEVFARYASALKNGYTKTFEEFKKESTIMGYITTGLGFAAGLFGDPSTTPSVDERTQRERRTKWFIGVGIGVALIGTAIFIYVKSTKK